MLTIGTMLSGGEGVGVGARAAGLRHLWGVEADARIAGVAQANGFNAIVARIQDVDPSTLQIPDVLHASPECQRASQARQADEGGRESLLDVEIGASVCHYLNVLRPRIFTLENVWGYRNFTAFEGICATLNSLGYFYHYANINAADYGVPQTRRRLILRAVRGGLLPELPAPEPRVGWYQAIEDLIPDLPESQFAPWQLARLPDSFGQNTLLSNHFGDPQGNVVNTCPGCEPAHTVSALNPFRAFILSNAATEWGDGLRVEVEPAHSITGESNGRTRAFIVDQVNSSTMTTRQDDAPVFTLSRYDAKHQAPRAFIVGGQFAQPANGDGATRPAQQADEAEPVFCVTAVNKGDWKAWLSQGRVVKMTPRCLARFQSFPDSYVLPDNNALACRVIGNAVAPLMYQKIIRQLVR